jgi:hypothetical protein
MCHWMTAVKSSMVTPPAAMNPPRSVASRGPFRGLASLSLTVFVVLQYDTPPIFTLFQEKKGDGRSTFPRARM